MDIIERLKFDSARCEATYSKGVAKNIDEAIAEIERLKKENDYLQTIVNKIWQLLNNG